MRVKAYVLTTGVLFGLLVLVHLWRFSFEGPGLWRDPFYVVSTIVPAGLFVWAWRLYRSLPR